jgi:vacuolar-type H+-ATPase subunit F/Vma7
MAESIGNAVQRDRQALRDSVARMLKTSTPIRNENRSAIADQITQAIGRRYAAIVIVTDLIENVRTEIDSIRVPEGMTVVLVLVPAADAYGGADATARWATIFTDRVKGIYVLPYTELDNSDFWTASPHFMQRVSGPSG